MLYVSVTKRKALVSDNGIKPKWSKGRVGLIWIKGEVKGEVKKARVLESEVVGRMPRTRDHIIMHQQLYRPHLSEL